MYHLFENISDPKPLTYENLKNRFGYLLHKFGTLDKNKIIIYIVYPEDALKYFNDPDEYIYKEVLTYKNIVLRNVIIVL